MFGIRTREAGSDSPQWKVGKLRDKNGNPNGDNPEGCRRYGANLLRATRSAVAICQVSRAKLRGAIENGSRGSPESLRPLIPLSPFLPRRRSETHRAQPFFAKSPNRSVGDQRPCQHKAIGNGIRLSTLPAWWVWWVWWAIIHAAR